VVQRRATVRRAAPAAAVCYMPVSVFLMIFGVMKISSS
jgi:hypothetical protein